MSTFTIVLESIISAQKEHLDCIADVLPVKIKPMSRVFKVSNITKRENSAGFVALTLMKILFSQKDTIGNGKMKQNQ